MVEKTNGPVSSETRPPTCAECAARRHHVPEERGHHCQLLLICLFICPRLYHNVAFAFVTIGYGARGWGATADSRQPTTDSRDDFTTNDLREATTRKSICRLSLSRLSAVGCRLSHYLSLNLIANTVLSGSSARRVQLVITPSASTRESTRFSSETLGRERM